VLRTAVLLLIAVPHQPTSPAAAAAEAPAAELISPALLEPIVTVATRAERPLSEVAGNVTIVTRDALDRTLTQSLGQTFRYHPGIDASATGTRFGTEGIIVRGLGGNRVAMELDGVPLSQQFAVGNFASAIRDLTDVGLVDRIEVLHGPASALYGSSALGGIVSFRTPDPAALSGKTGGPGPFVSQALRSSDDSRYTLGGAAASGDSLGALGMIGLRSGHERDAKAAEDLDRQDTDDRSGLAKLVYETPGGHVLRASYYGHDSDVETNVRSVLGTGRFASTTRLDGDDRYRLELVAAELTLGPSVSLDGGTLRAWSGVTDIRQHTVDERGAAARPVRIDRRFDYEQDSTGLSVDLHRRFTTGGWAHLLAAGVEWNGQRIEESRTGSELGLEDGERSDTVLGETFPLRDFPVSDVSEIGLYLHDELDLGRARIIAGLRFDRYDLDPDPDPVYAEDNPNTVPVSISENELSPKLGLVIGLSRRLSAWLQYAHGFREPPFEDANIGLDIPLFNVRAIPNPDLRPETSDGFEAGLRWRSGRARVDANLFHTRYDDFIESKVRLGVDPVSGRLLFQSLNVEEARIYGAEIGANLSLDPWLRGVDLGAAAYWARGDNRETDRPLNSVGPAQAVLAATWSSPDGRGEVSLFGTFTARHSRLDDSRGPLFEAPGYALFDLYASRHLGRHLVLRAGVENLLDRTFWQWADVRGLAPDDPTVPLLSQPGRSLALDLRWNFRSAADPPAGRQGAERRPR
jgi:hemoglobin/transferrin/lactoferrin receptor protein